MRVKLHAAGLRQPAPVEPQIEPKVDQFIRERARLAAFLRFEPGRGDDPRATKLCGTPYLVAGEGWPHCEGCDRPLHHLFQLNLAEVGLAALEGVALLSFFYCVHCAPNSHQEAGWSVRLREDLSEAPVMAALPTVPPQEEQPLPVILLGNEAQGAQVRLGPDAPSPFDDDLRELVQSVEGDPRLTSAAAVGATKYARIQFRNAEGERSEFILPMTARTEFNPADWTGLGEIEHWEVLPIPASISVWPEYEQFLADLYKPAQVPAAKVGGWAHGWQEPRFAHCSCGERLEPIATIITTNHTPFVVGDVGGLYLAGCPSATCPDQALRWWVDW